jgi:hypothetical protein
LAALLPRLGFNANSNGEKATSPCRRLVAARPEVHVHGDALPVAVIHGLLRLIGVSHSREMLERSRLVLVARIDAYVLEQQGQASDRATARSQIAAFSSL